MSQGSRPWGSKSCCKQPKLSESATASSRLCVADTWHCWASPTDTEIDKLGHSAPNRHSSRNLATASLPSAVPTHADCLAAGNCLPCVALQVDILHKLVFAVFWLPYIPCGLTRKGSCHSSDRLLHGAQTLYFETASTNFREQNGICECGLSA